jgi:hypothetical protein
VARTLVCSLACGALVCACTVGGVFPALASTAAAPPPTSPAALTAGALTAAGITGTRLAARLLVAAWRLISPRRLVGAWRLVGALGLFRARYLVGTRRLRALTACTAVCLRGAFGAPRWGIAAVLAARPSVAPRVPRSVSPRVAISVAVSAVAISIPVAAAAASATIAIVTRVAMRRPVALGLRG